MSALVHLGTIKLRGGTAGDEWTPLDRAFLNQWLAADSEDDSEDDIGDHSEDDAEDDGEDGGEHDAKADAENDAEDDSEKEEDGEDDMDEKDIAAADTLAWCLEDSTLGVTAECSRRGDSVLIRVAVLANDAGHWRMTAARTHLIRELFALLDKSWDGGGGKVLVDDELLGVGIQALYALIASPPEPKLTASEFIGDTDMFTALKNYENPVGVQTMMYKYQIRSVARMLQMESQPDQLVDPAYTAFDDAETGDPYYVNMKTMNIIRFPARYPLPRGGILCEQMGVGKTLMCLALVLASRHQPTQPPKDQSMEPPANGAIGRVGVSEVYTDVALREYATASADALRHAVGASHAGLTGTPRLAFMCADLVALHNPAVRYTSPWALTPSSEALLDARSCVYYQFPPPPRLERRAKRQPDLMPERFILAQTTLIVVPQLLIAQWLSEAKAHLEPGVLKIFTMGSDKKLPPIEALIRYDVILLSLQQFSAQGKKAPDDLYYDTELMKARWKRIILDEGNNSDNIKSNAMTLAKALHIERRWIVSGTPTTQLKQGTEDAERCYMESEGMLPVPQVKHSKLSQWLKADVKDAKRIGNMLKGFLSSELFQSDDFSALVTTPLGKSTGPEYGAVDRLRQIMSAVMVKHRPGVINEEVEIPPLTLSVQTLRFTPWQLLTYNALTALVVSNVYTSNFEDQDYFLHPKQAESFNQVVSNLHRACTWFVSATMDLEESINRNLSFLKKKESKGISYEHKVAVLEANGHMRRALDTPGWNEWMRNEPASTPFDTLSLPSFIIDCWSEAPDSQLHLIDAMSLRLLRELNLPGTTLPDLARIGWEERAHHPRCEELLKFMARQEEEWKKGRRTTVADLGRHHDDKRAAADVPKNLTLNSRPIKPKAQVGVKKRKEKTSEVAEDVDMDNVDTVPNLGQQTSLDPRPLPSTLLTSTRSAKINFVVRAVLTAPPTDKFVMFGTYDEIAHVHEALSLVGVHSVYAVQKIPSSQRNRAVSDFAKPNIRVIFLELKFAARGLTLTSGNRMIFLSPVWSLDVQAQAIKRIHRIGQKRATHIDILVTEGTFEEDIVRREASMRSQLMEQSYTRALIENPRFASAEYDDLSTFPIRLVPLGSELTHGESDEYARLVAGVAPPHSTPSGTAATTPIVTPGTPNGNTTGGPATEPDVAEPSRKVVKDMQKRGKAHFESDADEDTSAHTPVPATATKPGPARKRARFAD